MACGKVKEHASISNNLLRHGSLDDLYHHLVGESTSVGVKKTADDNVTVNTNLILRVLSRWIYTNLITDAIIRPRSYSLSFITLPGTCLVAVLVPMTEKQIGIMHAQPRTPIS